MPTPPNVRRMPPPYPGTGPSIPVAKLIGGAIVIFVVLIASSQMTYIVKPGYRGVKVTLGAVAPNFLKEGFGFKQPFITRIVPVDIRQRTQPLDAECYSSDLQQMNLKLQVLFALPEASVVRSYQEYAGDPFHSLIAPRVLEALKEVTALQTAETVVTNRLLVKNRALALARQKADTNFLNLVDLVIQDISLSKELEHAIEQKMVQEQEAAKARFAQRQAEIDAETAIIKARGEADSIRIRGLALEINPTLLDWKIVEKWDGQSPLVIGGREGAGNLMITLPDLQSPKR
jgi:prohibitin 2